MGLDDVFAEGTDRRGSGAVERSDPVADEAVCVVSTRPDTFEACQKGGYPSPESYDRTQRQFSWLACYRTAPVSAITHCAPVTDRILERRGDDGWMTSHRWERLVDPFAETDAVVVFELGDLRALSNPIDNDASGVRGAWYCTLGDLAASETISELTARGD